MMLSQCRHQPLLASKPLPAPRPSIPFFLVFSPTPLSRNVNRFRCKSLRRTSALASASADTQTLPQSAIQRISEKLRSLGFVEDDGKEELHKASTFSSNTTSPGEIFVPLPEQLAKHRVGHTLDPSWSTPENPVPEPGSGTAIQRFHELKCVALKEEEQWVKRKNEQREKVPTLAELTLPKDELRRLRTVGIALRKKLKIGKAGITEGIVNGIHERWRHSELVKITCEDLCRINMKRTHDMLERKTGGLVIWRSGSNIILYRGSDYKYPYFQTDKNSSNDTSDSVLLNSHMGEKASCSSDVEFVTNAGLNSSSRMAGPSIIRGVGSPNKVRFQLPGEAQLEEQADSLLEGLGPRFADWWGYDPLPVDADQLPAVVPGYRRPFRLLPYGVKPKLTNDEMTILKRLGRPLPCHFALGRNRKLQGLAASMLKLWEKCEIAKIAIKRGVQNTSSELMAQELKWLTGGTLLSRDREFIVFYRGKDFLPATVASAIEKRRKYEIDRVNCGEAYRWSITNGTDDKPWTMESPLYEGDEINEQKLAVGAEQRKLKSTEVAIERTTTKLSVALVKKAKAEELLAELDLNETKRQQPEDKEGITEEERHMLRRVGLRMKPFLLLGRRGVFDGTVENMHLHWKYRELVKILSGARSNKEAHGIAQTLEAESGGILVAVERVSKGYAIIVYRGKNYNRPASLRPQTLLTKREALKRSIEAQRRESLKLHVLKLNRNVDDLELQLAKDKEANEMQLGVPLRPQVQEQERDKILSAEKTQSNTLAVNNTSVSLSSTYDPMNVEAGERHEAQIMPFNSNDDIEMSNDNLNNSQQNMQRYLLLKFEDEFDQDDQGPLSESVPKIVGAVIDVNGEGDVESATRPDDLRSHGQINNAAPPMSDISSLNSLKGRSNLAVQGGTEKWCDGIPFRAARLSNRERLLLRKEALKMKKRPVLAVGRSNVVTGVVKAIKMHFQRHPIAIVNVKGRAKGTSVQEVVFKLEQATGAVLVSQEPSKVILYRGWGAGEEPARNDGKFRKDLRNPLSSRDGVSPQVVSPELISAIRLECGLQCNQGEEVSA